MLASVSNAMRYVPARLTHDPSDARWEEGLARCMAVLAPNGSRLSCGRLARWRVGNGADRVEPGALVKPRCRNALGRLWVHLEVRVSSEHGVG